MPNDIHDVLYKTILATYTYIYLLKKDININSSKHILDTAQHLVCETSITSFVHIFSKKKESKNK